MQQMVITYVLSGLANIADVNPRDVHASLFNGNIRVSNVSLRPETMNKILPLSIEEGTVPEMEVQIPNPSTAAPMDVKVRRARLLLKFDLSSPPEDRTPEQILRGITANSILGDAVADAVTADSVGEASELLSPASESGEENLEANFSAANSEIDEEDFASCASDSEYSDSENGSFGFPPAPEDAQAAGAPGAGWFGYLRSRAAQSVEWIWRRQLSISFTDITMVLPCDARKNIHYEISADSFTVIVEPTQTTGKEQMKIVNLEIGGAHVFASAGDARSRIVVVEALSVKITTVYEASTERVLRKNVVVSFHGTNTLTADEVTLFALLKCHLSREARLAVPPYCLPFATLRARGSLWPYTRACVLQGLRDHKQRFNFNASYLRFYAQARERYLTLLNECHRAQSILERQQQLIEAEQDLRHEDVILFLRHHVQAKYAAKAAEPEVDANADLEPLVVSSTHFEWKLVKLVLPARNTVYARNTALILRNEETIFTINAVSLESDGVVQTVAAPTSSSLGHVNAQTTNVDEETSLVYLHMREDAISAETKVSLQRLSLKGSVEGVLRCVTPIAEALQKVSEQAKAGVTTPIVQPASASASAPAPARVDKLATLIIAVHCVEVQLDDFYLLVDRLSCTTASAPGTAPKLGCTMKQCVLRHKEAYVLAPMEVRMAPRGNVVVSRLALQVPKDTWAALRESADSIRLLYEKYPRFGGPPLDNDKSPGSDSTGHPAANSSDIDLPAMKDLAKVLQWSAVTSCPPIEVEEMRIEFIPIDTVILMKRVSVQTVATASRGPFGTHVSMRRMMVHCHYTGRMSLKVDTASGMRIGLSPEPAQATVLSLPEVTITGRRGTETEDLALLAMSGVDGVVHGSVQYFEMHRVLLANSVAVENAELVYKTDPTVPLFNDRPCLTSYMQVSAEVKAVDVEKLCALPSRALKYMMNELYAFVIDELVPENYYRTFFSCFSDMSLQLRLHDCVVRCGADDKVEELLVSVVNSTSEAGLTALNVYRPHLLASTDNFPIVMFNDISKMSMTMDVSCLAVRVSARPSVSPSDIAVTVTGLKYQMPLEKMPFWRPEAMEIPVVPQHCTVESVKAAVRLDQHTSPTPTLEASLSSFTMDSATSSSVNNVNSLALSASRDIPQTPSESDRGSCASSAEEEVETTHLTLRRWSLSADFSSELSEFCKLQHMTRSLMNAADCFSRYVVLRDSVDATGFHLDDCGDVFLDAPTKLLVLEDCTFYAPSADRHIVVCPGTCVVFRRCIFYHPPDATALIRTASRSALYTCEECRVSSEAVSSALTSPIGTNAPSTTPLSDGASEVVPPPPPRRSVRTTVVVDEGAVAIQLDPVSRLMCTQRSFSWMSKRKTRRTFAKVRNSELRVEYVDPHQRLLVLTKTVVEGEMAVQLPRRSCTVSCSVNSGEVTIPMVLSKVRAVQERVSILTAAADTISGSYDNAADMPNPPYVVPPPTFSSAGGAAAPADPPSSSHTSTTDRFSYDSWKVLLSLSLIPVAVQLPGGMKVAKVTLSNAFVWSKREPFAEAQLEARVALHDMALWEWQQQAFKPVVSSPVFLGVQGHTASPLNLNVTASLSPLDAAVSTDQLKLLLHSLVQHVSNDSELNAQETAMCALHWRNDAGVDLRIRGAQSETVTVPAAFPPGESTTPCVTAPFTITDVDGVAVDHVEKDVAADLISVPGRASAALVTPEALFATRKVVVLADKRRLHVTSTLNAKMVQEICVRTVVQIQNSTPFALVLSAASQREQRVLPFGLSCVPEAMQTCSDLSVSVAKGEASAAGAALPTTTTAREPLFPDFITSSEFYQRCYQQGYPAAPVAREFISQVDGSTTYMVTAFEMRGPVLLLVFRAARPHVVNNTVYPLHVDAVDAKNEVLASARVEAGENAFFLSLAPHLNVRARLRMLVADEVYAARDTVALFDREAAAADYNVVLAHTVHPRRYFFEVNLSVAADGPAGKHGVAITTTYLCLVKNCTTTDLVFTTEEGDAVGTMGTAGLSGACDTGAVGYVPSNSVLCIKPKNAAKSEPFEIDDGGEGCVIQCDHSPTPSAFSASYFLLHRIAGSATKMAELLPSVIFRNRHRGRMLCVKHVIRQSGSTKALEETVLEVGPQSSHCYYTLSKYGYTNDLLFAWKREAAASAEDEQGVPEDFSSVVETDLAPGTKWSGCICCGATHHQVDIAKGHLYEPAYVTVGPAVLPRVKLVNLTTAEFREVARYAVAFPQPSKNNKYLLLTSKEGTGHTIDLMQEEPVELEPGVMVQAVRGEDDRCSIVLSSGVVFVTTEKTWADEVQLAANVQTSSLSLRLRDGNAAPLQLLWQSFATNIMWWSATTSVQMSVTGLCFESHYEGRKQQVIEPFDADVSVREMRSTTRDVYLKGFYIGLQPLTITVSDVLLYQLQVVGARCQVAAPLDVLAWVHQRVSVSILQGLPASMPQLLHIGSAGISETPLELSWDRSSRPPPDYLLGGSTILKLIPSLHHAMIVIPKLQLRNVSRVTPGELAGRIQQILILEVVKQIPKMVTTVGLFKKNTSLLEKVTSTVSSFLFRSSKETNTTDDGSSALI